jgi:nucleotide-binding universal stress UspA family protein
MPAMTILAATDLSDNSRAALRSAARLAERRNTPLEILYCEELGDPEAPWRAFVSTPWEEPGKLKKRAAEKLKSFADETLADIELTVPRKHLVDLDSIEDAILEREERGDLDCIVVGATGRGQLARLLLGTTAEAIVRRATSPVCVVPPQRALDQARTILAPVDLSDCSRASLQMAVDLAREHEASVHVLRALPIPNTAMVPYETDVPPVDFQTYKTETRQALERFVGEVDTSGVDVTVEQMIESPTTAILSYADDHDIDLIVMGTHGRSGIDRFFLGSTATKVLRRPPCPICTVRRADTGDTDHEP